ncbi:MAG: hypothetical protein JO323_20805 [Acidobacteriia bacterium]|nr:hypothetical protein [Terriglobia bacterium]
MMFARLSACIAVAAGLAAAQSLDFEVYRTKVEPIFLKHREGHARCVVCHEASNSAFRLQQPVDKTSGWTEEQSRKNFQFVSNLVKPGDPAASKLLIHPLAPEAGGDKFHGGGHQFTSQDDPDWKTIAAWIRGGK